MLNHLSLNIDQYYPPQKCRSATLVSGNIIHLWLFEGISC